MTKTILQPSNVKIKIEGKNLILRPIEFAEIDQTYLSWINDPGINKYLDEVRHAKQNRQSAVEYINALRSKAGCELFSIMSKNQRLRIGTMGISFHNPHNQGNTGYGLMIGDARAQLMGLGGEATILIVEFLFRDPHIRKIQEFVYSINQKAWKTLEFLGFTREGIFREQVVLGSGAICDLYPYGLLRSEWEAQRGKFSSVLNEFKIRDY